MRYSIPVAQLTIVRASYVGSDYTAVFDLLSHSDYYWVPPYLRSPGQEQEQSNGA